MSGQPTVVASRLYAADALGAAGRSLGKLDGVTLSVGAEWFHIEGAASDGTLALAEVLTGRRAPRRGQLRVAGHAPHGSPATRARIASLWPTASLPTAWPLHHYLPPDMLARLDALLVAWGFGAWSRRGLAALGEPERRTLSLALCLALAQPLALVLVEPFTTLAAPVLVQRLLRARADAGASVMTIAASAPDGAARAGVAALADRSAQLRGGTLRPAPATPLWGIALSLASKGAARTLASALLVHPRAGAQKVVLDAPSARVKLYGQALQPLALAAVEVAATHDLRVMQIQPLQRIAQAEGAQRVAAAVAPAEVPAAVALGEEGA